MSLMLYPISGVRNFIAGVDHPEGIAVGHDGSVYTGGEAGQVYRISPDGKKIDTLARTGGFCLGITLDQEENIYVCDLARRALLKVTQNGKIRVLADSADGREFAQPNFAVFDSRVIFTSAIPGDGRRPTGLSTAWIAAAKSAYSRPVLFISPMAWRSTRRSNTSTPWRAIWTVWCVLKSNRTAPSA